MDEALVKNPENNVHGGESGEDEHFLVRQRILKGLCRALEGGVDGIGHADFAASRFDVIDGRAERSTRSEIEGESNRRKDALVIHGNGGSGRLVMRERAEGNELAGLGRNVDGFQSFGRLLKLGSDFENDVVLIQAFINVGYLTLAESVAQRVIDVLNGDAKTRGGVAVDDQRTLEAF